MKLLISLILLTPTLGFAADTTTESVVINENPMNFGAQVGLNITNASLGAKGTSLNRAGFQLGALLEVPVTPGLLYLQPELSFVQRGAENSAFGPQIKARLNYLEAGLLAKAKINMADVKPFAFAGPHFGYLLNASGEGGGTTLDRSQFRSADLGFDIGGGVGIATGERSEVLVSARFTSSLLDAIPSDPEWRSEGFLVNIGYLF